MIGRRILQGMAAAAAMAALVAASPSLAQDAAASKVDAQAPATLSNKTPEVAGAIMPDPAVRRGVLANGLRYALMRNVSPKGALSIRLGFDVGSFEENDDERG